MSTIEELVIGNEVNEARLAAELSGNSVFGEFLEAQDYEIHAEGGVQVRSLGMKAYRSVGDRIFNSSALKQIFGSVSNVRRAICDEFRFCEKIAAYGRLQTARLLRDFLLGAAVAKALAATAAVAIFMDPSFISVAAVLLVFYSLSDICGCGRREGGNALF
ncbi:MAG: hypothetical protein WBL23_18570 [Salinisphaera sp.]|uniref:hypothetical protein n=1 Tax=Salinisphaera sp. TaxID=1914330 RepID=UPI003C7D93E6